MALQYDPTTGKIIFQGKEVGQYVYENGRGRVRIDVTYECDPINWVVPISWFDSLLSDTFEAGSPESQYFQELHAIPQVLTT